jgi:drug/metabolite transporter (DMT)-like permease
MSRTPLFGLALAGAGTLFLTPDALLMRLSGMDGFQMVGWRGFLVSAVMSAAWLITSRDRKGEMLQMASGVGLGLILCQFFNATLFSVGVAIAPVAVVLIGVATVPVFAAILSWMLLGEPARLATWLATAAVLAGIGIAVLGGKGGGLALDPQAGLGALMGLGVALALALNFVILRARPRIPIMLVMACGSFLAGLNGVRITGPSMMLDGQVWAIAITGAVILPVSFFALSLASRHTHPANVSLLMLMETVLAPFWVWLGVGERPSPAMLLGGAIVVGSLAVYLGWARRQARRRAMTPTVP